MDVEVVFKAIDANPGKLYRESIRQARNFTLLCGSSSLLLCQKHFELQNFALCYQNIAKLLTHLSNIFIGLVWFLCLMAYQTL